MVRLRFSAHTHTHTQWLEKSRRVASLNYQTSIWDKRATVRAVGGEGERGGATVMAHWWTNRKPQTFLKQRSDWPPADSAHASASESLHWPAVRESSITFQVCDATFQTLPEVYLALLFYLLFTRKFPLLRGSSGQETDCHYLISYLKYFWLSRTVTRHSTVCEHSVSLHFFPHYRVHLNISSLRETKLTVCLKYLFFRVLPHYADCSLEHCGMMHTSTEQGRVWKSQCIVLHFWYNVNLTLTSRAVSLTHSLD